jgi:hypothetical protein
MCPARCPKRANNVDDAFIHEPDWFDIRLEQPKDGEIVLVRTVFGGSRLATFRKTPIPRWEEEFQIAEMELYPFWRPVPK